MAKRLISPIHAALVDLSGTIHIDNKITPGAVEAVDRLRQSGLKLKFVTNTTKESLDSLHNRLTLLGFKIEKNEIHSSLTAARDVIRKLKVRPSLMLTDDARKDFEEFDTNDPNAVVVGLSPQHFNYTALNDAFHLILKGYPLIAIHKARYYKKNDGLALGPGPFVEALEYATDTKAIVVGKPEKEFFLGAMECLDCDPKSCVMIGDDARDDIGGAINAGMQAILVKTGKYREGTDSEVRIDGQLLEIIDEEWRTDTLPKEDVEVPLEELPETEHENGNTNESLKEQEMRWNELNLQQFLQTLSSTQANT